METVSKKELIKANEKTLNLLRCYPGADKSTLAKLRNQSWPTLSGAINKLESNGILIKHGDNISVNPDVGWYAGIMVGGAQVKIVLVDFAYKAVTFEALETKINGCGLFQNSEFKVRGTEDDYRLGYIYFNTPNSYGELHEKINYILGELERFNEYLKMEGRSILGIGFAFTGAIDNKEGMIIKSHTLEYLGFNKLGQLINPDKKEYFSKNGIHICLDHNAKTAAVAEKYTLYDKNNVNFIYKDKSNILVLYLGSGLGGGLVLDNKIYRGCNNFSGEIGHIPVPCLKEDGVELYEESCSCGSNMCLEYRIRNDVFEMDLKTFKKEPSDKLRSIIINNPDKKKLLGKYVGYALNCIVNVLNVGLVIFTGKWKALTEGNDLWNYINEEFGNINLQYTRSNCDTILSTYGVLAPAIGAAICSAYEDENEIIWV
ncbi:MAG: ROK family protein [Blautia sp.]|nr:ROK family protein [Oliverpabstia sp.]MDY4000493.1 ROK family protein [Blautia sp.]